MVLKHFYPENDSVSRCILEYDETPIGYMQYYPLDEEESAHYGFEASSAGEIRFGLDQFIGDPSYWNRGIGQHWIGTTLRHLAERQFVDGMAYGVFDEYCRIVHVKKRLIVLNNVNLLSFIGSSGGKYEVKVEIN